MTAETSKTVIEIYQPLIIGLGAVGITLLGNTFIEWWKDKLARNRDLKTIRRALMIHFMHFNSIISNLGDWLEGDDEECFVSFHGPEGLIDFDREKIGRLTLNEALAVGNAITVAEGLLSTLQMIPKERQSRVSNTYIFRLNASEAGAFRTWLTSSKKNFDAAFEALKRNSS